MGKVRGEWYERIRKISKAIRFEEELNLTNLTPDIDMSKIEVTVPDINRPALRLAGYLDHFAAARVQIIGYVEFTYLQQMERVV